MRAAVNDLLPLRFLPKAGKLNIHPSCCAVEFFQGIRIERVCCGKKKKARMREISYPALALNSTIFQIWQINYIFRACIMQLQWYLETEACFCMLLTSYCS